AAGCDCRAAGADVARVLALDRVPSSDGDYERLPALPLDIDHLRTAIKHVAAALFVVDPISAFLGGGDEHASRPGLPACLARVGEAGGRNRRRRGLHLRLNKHGLATFSKATLLAEPT